MKADNIIEIGINEDGQLYIKPSKEQFTMIWRSATEVHWNEKEKYLYSPKPREWSYLDWYKHIISVVEVDCACKLFISIDTSWINIAESLKSEIIELNK